MTVGSPPLTDAQFEALVDAGHDVLRAFPRLPGACVMMSALYAGRLHSLGHTSVRLVGGALAIGTSTVFGNAALATSAIRNDYDWDGHAWLTFGEYLADVSLVMTAYSDKAPRVLARHIASRIKPTQRLYIATYEAALREDALRYTPQKVFSCDQIAALYGGALTFLSDSG